MTIYLHSPCYLEQGKFVSCFTKQDYLDGKIVDKFDSLQYLHLRSHRCLDFAQSAQVKPVSESGWFYKSESASQSELALALLKEIQSPKCDLFVYCHNSFPEDLNKCQSAWLQYKLGIKAKYAFSVEYHGGMNIALALKEAMDWCLFESGPSSVIIAGAERILQPCHRSFHPLGWCSDAASAVMLNTEMPSTERIWSIEGVEIVSDPLPLAWIDSDRKILLNNTVQLTKQLFEKTSYKGPVIYPAFDNDIIKRLNLLNPGFVWLEGKYGMSYGLEIIATLCSKKILNYDSLMLVFIEPGSQVSGILIKRVV